MKVGSTTLRNWIYYKLKGKFQLVKNGDYIFDVGDVPITVRSNGYVLDLYEDSDLESVCIKRDPVKRFLSCYKDKILKEKFCGGVDLDTFLDRYDEFVDVNAEPMLGDSKYGFVWYHFCSQTKQLGADKSVYHKVFDISEVDTGVRTYLESKWKIELPTLHCRSSKGMHSSFEVTTKQIDRIKEIYREDYDNGWF